MTGVQTCALPIFAGDVWRSHLDTPGSRDLAHLNAFIRGLEWHTLVPSGLDGMRELITRAGSCVRAHDYIAAAASRDGSLLVAYVPPEGAGSFDVDLRAMRGPVRARWFDPTDGSWRAIADALTAQPRPTPQPSARGLSLRSCRSRAGRTPQGCGSPS